MWHGATMTVFERAKSSLSLVGAAWSLTHSLSHCRRVRATRWRGSLETRVGNGWSLFPLSTFTPQLPHHHHHPYTYQKNYQREKRREMRWMRVEVECRLEWDEWKNRFNSSRRVESCCVLERHTLMWFNSQRQMWQAHKWDMAKRREKKRKVMNRGKKVRKSGKCYRKVFVVPVVWLWDENEWKWESSRV